jgi:uncharacterized protein (TIGR03435 family)
MKNDKSDLETILRRSLRAFGPPTPGQLDASRGRIRERLASGENTELDLPFARHESRRRWLIPAAAAVCLASAVSAVFLPALISPERVYAIVQMVDGSLYRVTDGKTQVVNVGEKISAGTPVRTDRGAVLKLSDGGSIEMHAKSELSLEPAEDGVRIRLNDGSVHVTPAKQPAGNLYVQNREVTVPVIGAMFQSARPPVVAEARQPPESLKFEEASVRLKASAGAGGGRGGTFGQECAGGNRFQVDPRRFTASATLYNFMAVANGLSCSSLSTYGLLTGGPSWIRSDLWDIQALIPEGLFGDTPRLSDPKLQKMLQALLSDRFKVVTHRNMKELPSYNLIVAAGGSKLTPWKAGDTRQADAGWNIGRPNEKGEYVAKLRGVKAPMTLLPVYLEMITGRPIVDQTGFTGDFNYYVEFAPLEAQFPSSAASIFRALEEQLGLKLEPSTVSRDVLVVDHVEMPSEN